MTPLKKPVSRRINGALDGSFGPDSDKRIVVTLLPGDGAKIHDLLELRPERTRRAERIAVIDVYRYAIRCRVNRELLERARNRKAKHAAELAARRLASAEKRLTREVQP